MELPLCCLWRLHLPMADLTEIVSVTVQSQADGPDPSISSRGRLLRLPDLKQLRLPIRSEYSVPKKVDHRKIAIRVAVMHEMEVLLPSEPGESVKARSINVIFPVKIYMRVKGSRTRKCLHDEQVERQ